MHRFTAALVTVLSVLAPAPAVTATLKGPTERPDPGLVRLPPTPAPKATTPPPALALGGDTEVVLDGRPCDYKDVPANAVIVRVEVGPDRTTIRRIEFRRAK